MSEALESNRKQRISALEGVTYNSGKYWEAINKIDIDHSKLSPKVENGYLILFLNKEELCLYMVR